MRADCPWYLSARAVREYASLLGLDPSNEDHFDRCEEELVLIVRGARFFRVPQLVALKVRGT